MSEYRRNHAVNREDMTCFTTKIKCGHCGCNFLGQTQQFKDSPDGKMRYWRCSERNGCETQEMLEDALKALTAEVLGISEFEEDTFLREIDSIRVDSAKQQTFIFKYGREVIREWKRPKRKGKPWSEERRARTKESIKNSWTNERRKAASETVKRIRREKK